MPGYARRYLSILALVSLTFGGASLLAAKCPASEHPFPISPGTYWVYRGHVRWTQVGGNHVSDAEITWRTEIRKVIAHGDTLGIVINGFPFDSAWADDHATPSDSLLVESNGKFYFLGDERFQPAIRRLEQPSDSLDDLFSKDDLILEWPLTKGQKFCDTSGMARTDDRYCWVVASSTKTALLGVAGVAKRNHVEFALEYWTNPDNTRFVFVPDVGITKYEYHHHGTVADTNLDLAEFHPAANGRK